MKAKENLTDYKSILEKDGVLAQHPVGFSMYPMLRQNYDTVIIKKIDKKPCQNDVVFYQKDDGKYVLHRVIKVKKNGYVIRGDNCFFNEYDVKDRHILGILEGFYRGEKYIDCNKNVGYKFYVFFYRRTYYIRYAWRSVLRFLSKIKRKIFK